MQEIKIGKLYKHYKGNIYKVIALAKHSETLENMIVYESVKNRDIWVRPMSMWDEIIDNTGTRRFTIMEDS